jgi:hypothetical protein
LQWFFNDWAVSGTWEAITLSALGIDSITKISSLLTAVNNTLDSFLPWAALVIIVGYDIYYFINNRVKRDVVRQLIIWIIIEILLIAIFWVAPNLLSKITGNLGVSIRLRWAFVAMGVMALAYFYGHENGERRWFLSAAGHLGVILFGWWCMDQWMGLLLFSLPLILAYDSALYIAALVLLPASNPEDPMERWKRFVVLASYTWGFQFPIFVVSDHAWKEPEKRINGDYTRSFKVPGLIWTKSHQVVGVTGGTQFNRVDGPGVIFTGKLEQPLQVIDLRLQIRSNEIDVATKDGLSFIVRVLAVFRMDHEVWDNKTYARLRAMNPLLQDAKGLSYTLGSFPFSHRRVQAALGTTSVKSLEPEKVIPWDQWALNIVNEETRKVVSQKNLDEFWRPADDEKGANAMDEIAKEIKGRSEWTLRSKGILLLASRVVNFRFPSNEKEKLDEISRRQIATWAAEWERKRAQKLADAEADAERVQQEARAYAESLLLNSIAEALQKTYDADSNLHKHVIVMRYLSALQDFAHKNTPEEEEKIKELHNILRGQL